MLYVSLLINVRNCLGEVSDWLNFQVFACVLLQCSYHYGISHENRTSISRRCEQIPFLYEVNIGLQNWYMPGFYSCFQYFQWPFVWWDREYCRCFSNFKSFTSFISLNSSRCTWILTAKLWVCLPQWWFSRSGNAIKCHITR